VSDRETHEARAEDPAHTTYRTQAESAPGLLIHYAPIPLRGGNALAVLLLLPLGVVLLSTAPYVELVCERTGASETCTHRSGTTFTTSSERRIAMRDIVDVTRSPGSAQGGPPGKIHLVLRAGPPVIVPLREADAEAWQAIDSFLRDTSQQRVTIGESGGLQLWFGIGLAVLALAALVGLARSPSRIEVRVHARRHVEARATFLGIPTGSWRTSIANARTVILELRHMPGDDHLDLPRSDDVRIAIVSADGATRPICPRFLPASEIHEIVASNLRRVLEVGHG
jgi:hypothetical protein